MGIFQCHVSFQGCTLPETNMAPENEWLEDEFPFGFRPIFRAFAVSLGRVDYSRYDPGTPNNQMNQ